MMIRTVRDVGSRDIGPIPDTMDSSDTSVNERI